MNDTNPYLLVMDDETLNRLSRQIGAELLKRQVNCTKDLLVERYGVDGQKQLNVSDPVDEQVELKPAYLLDQIPFDLSYDNTEECFIWTPSGKILDEVHYLLRSTVIGEMTMNHPDLEFLIKPQLHHNSQVFVRGAGELDRVAMPYTLSQLVAWYLDVMDTIESNQVLEFIELRPMALGTDDQLLTTFDSRSITPKYPICAEMYSVAPLRVDQLLNIKESSTLGALIRDGRISPQCKPGHHMRVESIYLSIGGHLIRQVIDVRSQTKFYPKLNSLVSPELVLNFTAVSQLNTSDTDAFHERFEFMELLEPDDRISISVDLHGRYNHETGELLFTAGPARIDVEGSIKAKIVGSLLLEQTHVLAVAPVGNIIP